MLSRWWIQSAKSYTLPSTNSNHSILIILIELVTQSINKLFASSYSIFVRIDIKRIADIEIW